MKRLVLTVLVAMVPFLMMAQKNKRKNKSITASEQLMVIKGVQIVFDTGNMGTDDMSKEDFHHMSKQVAFAPIEVLDDSGVAMSLEDALDAALTEGWQVYSANTVAVGNSLVYFYYMKK